MKKTASIVLVILLICFCGCSTNVTSIEQSEKNFIEYGNKICEIAEKAGLEAFVKKDMFSPSLCSDLQIVINENTEIWIRLMNSAYESQSGIESFSIQYRIGNNGTEAGQFDTRLFAELINAMSGKPITADFCDDFLEAPEDQYPASDYGFEKLNGEKIAKQKPLNFFEDWTIFYTLEPDGSELLEFGGITKT